MVTIQDVIKKLESKARPDQLEGMARYGMEIEQRLGVSVPDMRKLAKEVGKDHKLALGLWKTGITEARIIAGMVAEPEKLTEPQMEEIYHKTPLDKIPWNIETPPDSLVELVESGEVKPCKTIDLGCGIGNYSIYLASKGFKVTGIDISPSAIKTANENAKNKCVKCNFIVADVIGDLAEIKQTFDFAFDWELLHHIYPENRNKYIENVNGILNPGGKYLSVCFSEKSPQFGGSGKYRETPLGTILYFSSEAELRNLFEPYFDIQELKMMEIIGKPAIHLANYVFMTKKVTSRSTPY